MRYVALLRGVNVGGHRVIRMPELARLFSDQGLKNVATYIASGNVLFEAPAAKPALLAAKISRGLEKRLGYSVEVLLRTAPDLAKIMRLRPFGRHREDPKTKLYVTFLAAPPAAELKVPYASPKDDFRILRREGWEVYSLSFRMPDGRSGNGPGHIEKVCGVVSTTRNWNTVRELHELASAPAGD